MNNKVFKSNGDLFLEENTHTMYYKEKPIFAPSVSTIIGMIFPFDLTDFVLQIQKKNKISYEEAVKIKDAILKKAISRGTCVHYQIQMKIQNNQEVGCSCIELKLANKKTASHTQHFQLFKNWYVLHNLKFKNNEWKSEILYANPELTLTGAQDVLVLRENGIDWGDWKTTDKAHPKKEIMQILLYRFLATGNFEIEANEKFFAFNTNKHGVYWFNDEEIKIGISNAIKALKKWNDLSLPEKLSSMRPNWNEQKKLIKWGDLVLENNDLKIPYDKKYEKLIIEEEIK